MQTIYINGVKATHYDLATLLEYVRNGKEFIVEVRMTKKNNIAVVTA